MHTYQQAGSGCVVLTGRIRTHRTKDNLIWVLYTKVPQEFGGKSTARELEGNLIKAMEREGFSLKSRADARGNRSRQKKLG